MKKQKKYRFQYYSILGACCHCWTILISTEFCEGPIEQIYLVEEIHSWKKKKTTSDLNLMQELQQSKNWLEKCIITFKHQLNKEHYTN